MSEKQPTMMGKLLSRVHNARYLSRQQAIEDLWKRNGMENPKTRDGHKLAETAVIQRDGTEVTEYRLYKLIDATVVTVAAEVNTEVKLGIENLRENNRDGQ